MTVFENVAFPLRVTRDVRLSEAEIRSRVGEALEIVDMSALASRSATLLSGGQQQRVALARAIVRQPSLLLLDEPLSNLDARLRDEMRNELKRLQKQIGVTTIYVTHDQSEALDMSDKIAVINLGRLVQMGTPREIYFKPRDAFVAGFMGSLTLLEGRLDSAAAADSTAAVRLDGGGVVTANFPYAVGAGRVAVSVKPESFRLKAPCDLAAGGNALRGKVITSGFLGSTSRFTVQVEDMQLHVSDQPNVSFGIGDDVAVVFSPEDTLGLAFESSASITKAAA
jgi:iron(III) transport system ATP-binding protein